MRRAIDEGITRRMELEQALAIEEACRQEAEGAIAPLREANLDLTGKLQRAEDGLRLVEQVGARVAAAEERLQDLERQVSEYDAKLECHAAALESLAPYPDCMMDLEDQVGNLQREVDCLRDVELEGGEMEQLKKELAEERARLSDYAEVRARVAETEERLQDLERQVRERDTELECRATALESLAPYPDHMVDLEDQVGNLQREVDRLRDVELEAGEREEEMERLKKELAEEWARSSDFAEVCIRMRAAAETHRDKLAKARRDGTDKAVDLYLRTYHFQEKMNKAYALTSIRIVVK
ncbi:tropomyosin-like [Rosa chinensis]|uniref:tropomyosin-like n=1 Tax=Rosa chinensis TaxID=74649 RepID=UPI000D089D29|nr:tropomyosin-like [Rosa chinensis]